MKRKKTRSAKPTRAKRGAKSKAPANAAAALEAKPDAVDALVSAGTQALGLALDPQWHAGVKFNLQLILRHAALIDEFALPDDAEPAPVFHA